MENITIIIPVHKYDEDVAACLTAAVKSIAANISNGSEGLSTVIVCPPNISGQLLEFADGCINLGCKDISVLVNNGDTDFCSQVNYAAGEIEDDYFSILEFDDTYNPKWFQMAREYYFSNEFVSVFMPINVQHDIDKTVWQYCNEIVWATSFSNDLGFIDFDCLQHYSMFNLTGAIFNRKDFIKIGKLKPSIKVAFWYEFLLRLTSNKLSAFVVPKEGYTHVIGRPDSLTKEYETTLTDDDITKWFEVAVREYSFKKDRKKGIITGTKETVK